MSLEEMSLVYRPKAVVEEVQQIDDLIERAREAIQQSEWRWSDPPPKGTAKMLLGSHLFPRSSFEAAPVEAEILRGLLAEAVDRIGVLTGKLDKATTTIEDALSIAENTGEDLTLSPWCDFRSLLVEFGVKEGA